jgi:hypothetical protein
VSRLEPGGQGSLYRPLLEEVARFFRSGAPPVGAEETREILAFMEAADRSRAAGGAVVPLHPPAPPPGKR